MEAEEVQARIIYDFFITSTKDFKHTASLRASFKCVGILAMGVYDQFKVCLSGSLLATVFKEFMFGTNEVPED